MKRPGLPLRIFSALPALSVLLAMAGCYAPLTSPGIPAASLPDEYRMPLRTAGTPLNLGELVAAPPSFYLLGPGDQLTVLIPDLDNERTTEPLLVVVQETGVISLPHVGPIPVAGVTVMQAQERINQQLAAQDILKNPTAMVSLTARGTVKVMVLGEVRQPGLYELPRYENDIAHAIAAAGGFTEQAEELIEVHRRFQPNPALDFPTTAPGWGTSTPPAAPAVTPLPGVPISRSGFQSRGPQSQVSYRNASFQNTSFQQVSYPAQQPVMQSPPYGPAWSLQQPVYGPAGPGHQPAPNGPVPPPGFRPMQGVPYPGLVTMPAPPIERIPLRDTGYTCLSHQQRQVNSGDVIKIPTRRAEVFFVVGPLSEVSRVRFNVGDRDREIGNGFLLPRDREVDVITAVAMAGYIDPINSPTTVTVHRTEADGTPLLILVDLIAARSNPAENVLVRPGDIIYLNPDAPWWWRRTFNGAINTILGRVIPSSN